MLMKSCLLALLLLSFSYAAFSEECPINWKQTSYSNGSFFVPPFVTWALDPTAGWQDISTYNKDYWDEYDWSDYNPRKKTNLKQFPNVKVRVYLSSNGNVICVFDVFHYKENFGDNGNVNGASMSLQARSTAVTDIAHTKFPTNGNACVTTLDHLDECSWT